MTIYKTYNSKLPHDDVHAIAIDKHGNKWIGTAEGLIKV
jgi:ligand-binding sensor domain-containing protein